MFEFIRRIPELLGLKRKADPDKPPRIHLVAESGEAKPLRGRGTGRGTTPKGAAKPRAAGSAARRRK